MVNNVLSLTVSETLSMNSLILKSSVLKTAQMKSECLSISKETEK